MSARDLETDRRVAMLEKHFRSMNSEAQQQMIRFAALQAEHFPARPRPSLTLVHSTSNVGEKK